MLCSGYNLIRIISTGNKQHMLFNSLCRCVHSEISVTYFIAICTSVTITCISSCADT